MGIRKWVLSVYQPTAPLIIMNPAAFGWELRSEAATQRLLHRFMSLRPMFMGPDRSTNGDRGVATRGHICYSPPGMPALPAVSDSNGRWIRIVVPWPNWLLTSILPL
jgi:hypothetical protein